MKQLLLFLMFSVINFGGLAFGSWLMDNGPLSDWYTNLNQAPWTPPGWIFGVAWTIIMLCFSVYLSKLFTVIKNKQLITFPGLTTTNVKQSTGTKASSLSWPVR